MKLFRYTAAGGVVTNHDYSQTLLLIRPERDEVRLPKGKIEAGESLEESAYREVQEETGYGDLEIIESLGEQLIAFLLDGQAVQRTEYYFLMRALSDRRVERPPKDAAQFFTIWAPWETSLEYLTFEAEKDWVERALRALNQRELITL